MREVYIVTSGEYSDYGIRAVFSSRTDAEAFCRKFNSTARNSWDDHRLEEWPLDVCVDAMQMGTPYFVRMAKDGTTITVEEKNDSYGFERANIPQIDSRGNMFLFTWAKDAKHAIKIANEKRAILLATGEW